jgi:putative ATPase
MVGHDFLIGENGILRQCLRTKHYFSFLLAGNPGVGKTTIALNFVQETGCEGFLFNASTDNKAKLKDILLHTQYSDVFLIIDEIHRMNNDIQETLLPWLETGKVYLIGLTTLSPYQAVNIAIRSRCLVYQLPDLTEQEVTLLLQRAIAVNPIPVEEGAISLLVQRSNHEARTALNLLEGALILDEKHLTKANILAVSDQQSLNLDANQDHYYDLLSALQKSIRGSDVDAALYYLAQLIILGDLKIILRRMLVICYEDIGLANVNMGLRMESASRTCEILGLPECQKVLAVMAIDMSLAPKSNSADAAISKAIETIQTEGTLPPPDHALNRKIKLNPSIYHYPHNDPDSLNDQSYLPLKIKNYRFYLGKFESEYEKALINRNTAIKKLKKLV